MTRIHLEEDTGKSTHAGSGDGRIAGSEYSLVDFNRAGVPLMECVSEPDIRSAEEAVGFLEALKRTFVQLGISDVKMEEGSLRCDANVSIRRIGSTALGTKTEIKNMNSFKSVQRAIGSEIERQIEIVESGGRIVQETRGWDEVTETTHVMRSKEQAHDYRYFPDPDLTPLEITPADIERWRAELRELPFARFERYVDRFGLSVAQATQLVDNPSLADFFERTAAASNDPQGSANYVLGELSRLANETGVAVADSKVRPEAVAEVIELVGAKTINSKIAKDVIARLWSEGGSAKEIVERAGLAQVSDPAALERFVDEVLVANEKIAADIRGGKEKGLQFLVGQVMKTSRGKANPKMVEELLRKKITSA